LFNLNFNHGFNQTYIFPNQPQLKVLFIKITFFKPQPQQLLQYQTHLTCLFLRFKIIFEKIKFLNFFFFASNQFSIEKS
jgi:hypothetical protein